jgi:polysaccharide chain length determinant protein (PEP-CTERM system associated)
VESTPKPLNLQDYVAIGLRQKWFIIIPLVCATLISFGVYKYLPKVYKTTTLILVQPQRVPESYVRPTNTASITDRLNTISQEILSRTRLEKVIQEFNLFPETRNKVPMEEVVERMRKAIEVNVQSRPQSERTQNTFTISFEEKDPRIVMMVTNKLASLFIEENLKVRELQAEGTSEFISKELQSMEEQLKKKDEAVRNFKERFMGNLPQQLDANLRILERLQQQLQTTNEGIKTAEDRSILLQNQIEQLKRSESPRIQVAGRMDPVANPEDVRNEGGPEDPLITQLNNLKRELTSAQSKYTERHPDVIDLKRKITGLEPKVSEVLKKQEDAREARLREQRARRIGNSEERLPLPVSDPGTERLLTQYRDQYNEAQMDARRLRGEEKNLKDQLLLYQRRIENTPKREEELTVLTRDYDLLRANYQSLLGNKIQAQMAENLEKKQQGEQFKILDPARLPETPIRPDRNKILLIGTFIGLVAGLGLAWFRETLDQSFHSEADLEAYLGLPILAVVPNLKEEDKAIKA